jgi:hypothetical protein
LDQLCEDPIKVTFGACVQDMELQSEGASRCLLVAALCTIGVYVSMTSYQPKQGGKRGQIFDIHLTLPV